MVRMKTVLFALASFATAAAGPAYAATLTFEGEANTIYNAPISRSGYLIGNVVGDEQHFHEIDSTAFPGFVVSNGTGVLYNDRDSNIFMTADPFGGIFTLNGFDASAVAGGDGTGATNLLVSGYLGAALVNSANFTISDTGFASFGGLGGSFDRLVFDATNGGGGFQLDNVVLNAGAAVPEPATWALMITGFGMVGAGLRRRTTSVALAH